ncbi:MAG: DUF4301 family protein [Paludibacteraceae bacterium]|nr:DUF4301 family protein [Paludibacteraceae bacterium]
MYSEEDIKWLEENGITLEMLNKQLDVFSQGVRAPEIKRIATCNDGIRVLSDAEVDTYQRLWTDYIEKKQQSVVHFIPASGTANRLFRSLYQFYYSEHTEPQTNIDKNFFKHLQSFAFFNELNVICIEKEDKDIHELIEDKAYKIILEYMLFDKGTNYSQLPNALFKFHSDKSMRYAAFQKYLPKKIAKYASFEHTRTPIQENLLESAMVSGTKKGNVRVFFSVNKEHLQQIADYVEEYKIPIEKKLSINLDVEFSLQDPATQSVVVKDDNTVFRDKDEKIILTSAGHGALLDNLNAIDADIIFIKNIDNAVPDALKKTTSTYKKMLAGVLLQMRKKIRYYLKQIDTKNLGEDKLIEIIHFVENELNVKRQSILSLPKEALIDYLKEMLDRPLRVCGMVKKEEEQGGEPFWITQKDGVVTLQIIDFYQINNNEAMLELFETATHFNPVDIVCSIVDAKGHKYDLTKFVDNDAKIIVRKQKKEEWLKRLELPGLWNGAMANWNTIFVEVPVKTFNPVKTINDLLRYEHQSQ